MNFLVWNLGESNLTLCDRLQHGCHSMEEEEVLQAFKVKACLAMLIAAEKEGQDWLNEMFQDKDCTVRRYDNSNGIKTHFTLVNIYQHVFFSEIKSHGGSPEDLVSVESICWAELILCELGSNIQYVHGYLSHCVLLSEQWMRQAAAVSTASSNTIDLRTVQACSILGSQSRWWHLFF